MIAKSLLNHQVTVSRIISAFLSIYRHGKMPELLSFIFWELKYILGFYKSSSVKFNVSDFLKLNEETLATCPFVKNTMMDWAVICVHGNGNLYGSTKANPERLYESRNGEEKILFSLDQPVTGIFIAGSGTLFVSSGGMIYRYFDGILSEDPVLKFSTPKSVFLPNAFTEGKHGTLFVGEYVNLFDKKWHFAAYLYYSDDDGQNWKRSDFLKEKGTNKHIHIVKWSSLLDGLVLTDGDNKKKLWFNRSPEERVSINPDSGWMDISKRHINMGGYTAMVEVGDQIVFGTDYNGGTNFLVSTSDLLVFSKRAIPNPYRRSIFTNMTLTRQGEKEQIWAVLHGECGRKTKSLLMMSVDAGRTWNKVIEYDGKVFRVSILNNSKQVLDKLYISVEKFLPESTADIIRVSELKTLDALSADSTSLNTYTVEYSFN